MLVVVDVFTRQAQAVMLRDKKAATVCRAMRELMQAATESGHPLQHLWVDQGAEFTNKQMKDLLRENGASVYHTFGPHKSAIAERFIRTLREMVNKRAVEAGRRACGSLSRRQLRSTTRRRSRSRR